MHIGAGVYRVAGPDLTSIYDDSAYLVSSDVDKCYFMIDSGSGVAVDAMIRNILYVVEDLRYIKYLIITHAHHRNYGGAYYLLNMVPSILVITHYRDSKYMRNPDKIYTQAIDILGDPKPIYVSIEIQEELRHISLCNIDVTLINIPIHTKGSIGVFFTKRGFRYGFIGGLLEELFSRELSSEERDLLRRIGYLKDLDIMCHSRGCVYGRENISRIMSDFYEYC